MNRFYKTAEARAIGKNWEIALDGKPVKTPRRAPLAVPSATLANEIAGEWAAQDEKIDPRAMPLTGLANAAIDRIAPDQGSFAEAIAVYGETDLTCYRADGPDGLVAAQAEAWDPLLAWARRRYDVDFETVKGLMHKDQPADTVRQLAQAVAERDPFQLAALTQLVTLSGSLVIGLALAEGAIDPHEAWDAAMVDETWQAEQWGIDDEARSVREGRQRDFLAAHQFLTLLG